MKNTFRLFCVITIAKVAYSDVIRIESPSVLFPLYSVKKEEDSFTGTGSYYIFLFFNETIPENSHTHYIIDKQSFSGFSPLYIEFTSKFFNNLE